MGEATLGQRLARAVAAGGGAINLQNKQHRAAFISLRGGRCEYCGVAVIDDRKAGNAAANIDHEIPKARGGDGSLGNLRLSCGRCNMRKGRLTAAEWKNAEIERRRKIVEYRLQQYRRALDQLTIQTDKLFGVLRDGDGEWVEMLLRSSADAADRAAGGGEL